MIPIDKGVPIPRRRYGRRGPRPHVYPWAQMTVGDSFFVRGGGRSVTSIMADAARAHGHRYTSRAVTGGVRVWRIE